MHDRAYLTEMTLATPLQRTTLIWLAVTAGLAALYIVRALSMDIPPQDHIALSLILCFLLTQVAMSLEQTTVRISLPENRCWLFHHRYGIRHERSLPASQIHSAQIETQVSDDQYTTSHARIVLVTSLGMIPVSQKHQHRTSEAERLCRQINEFLASQELYLTA